MNNISIVIGVLFLVCVLIGWGRGLFKSILSAAGLIASIVVAVYLAPHVSGYLEEHTQFDEKIASYISQQLEYSEVGTDLSRGIQVSVINELPLPESMKSTILNNNNSETYDLLQVTGVYDYVAKSVAVLVLNVGVFLGLTLMCRILFFVLGRMAGEFSKLPIVRSIDKIGGGCLGAVKGLIYIWLFFLVLSICSAFDWSQNIITQINQNVILNMLFEHNLLLDIVGDLTRIIFR